MATSVMQSFKADCIRNAKKLGDYQKLSITELADGYCKALDESDEELKDAYCSALILRFWYTMKKMQVKTKTANYGSYEDYSSKLFYCISCVCAKGSRAWQDPTKNTTAQACINQAIATRGVAEIMYESNLNKNRANINTVSFDRPIGDDDESATLLDLQADERSDLGLVDAKISAEQLIQACINKDKVVEAVILDVIAFNDCNRTVKQKVSYTDASGNQVNQTNSVVEFWRHGTVQKLASLNDDFRTEFRQKYSINPAKLDAALNMLSHSPNQKIYRVLDATLNKARTMLGGQR